MEGLALAVEGLVCIVILLNVSVIRAIKDSVAKYDNILD